MTRQSEPNEIYRQPTPCGTCGYCFDQGKYGVRMCPKCAEADWAEIKAYVEANRPMLQAALEREEKERLLLRLAELTSVTNATKH